jgi:LacI family transcriptional regulator
VLVLLDTAAAWSRGILRGFMATAHERRWTLLHYHPPTDLDWLMTSHAPHAALVGPELTLDALAPLAPIPLVSAMVDHGQRGIQSICIREEAVARLAADHLLATGLRHVSTFRLGHWSFATAREQAFVERARAAGVNVEVGWGSEAAGPARQGEDPSAIVAWLEQLPKPCGIFTGTDSWGRVVARYARLARLRVPEDIALVGADNDTLECELICPPLSSVMIPWYEVGRSAAKLVQLALRGEPMPGERILVDPVTVVARRSSDLLAIDDALVVKAVRWIREHADRRVSVPMVARAVGGGRQRLERRFRKVLGRTVLEEIRRAHVEVARALLTTSVAGLSEIAKRSGFTNAALLNVAFQRELGIPPGTFRRRIRQDGDGVSND